MGARLTRPSIVELDTTDSDYDDSEVDESIFEPDYCAGLSAEIVFIILGFFAEQGVVPRKSCKDLLNCRLLNAYWNRTVLDWLQDNSINVQLMLSKAEAPSSPESDALSWIAIKKMAEQKSNQHTLYEERQVKAKDLHSFPYFAYLDLKVFSRFSEQDLTEEELCELIDRMQLRNIESCNLKFYTKQLDFPNDLFKALLSEKLSETLETLYWDVRNMTDDQLAILKEFCGKCSNLWCVDIKIDPKQLVFCFDFAKHLMSAKNMLQQSYSFHDNKTDQGLQITEDSKEVEHFTEFFACLRETPNHFDIMMPREVLQKQNIRFIFQKHGFKKVARTKKAVDCLEMYYRRVKDNQILVLEDNFIFSGSFKSIVERQCAVEVTSVKERRVIDTKEMFISLECDSAKVSLSDVESDVRLIADAVYSNEYEVNLNVTEEMELRNFEQFAAAE